MSNMRLRRSTVVLLMTAAFVCGSGTGEAATGDIKGTGATGENTDMEWFRAENEAAKIVPGPYGHLVGFSKKDGSLAWKLDHPVGSRGTVAFWFKADHNYASGGQEKAIRVPMVEIDNVGAVVFEARNNLVRLSMEWAKGIPTRGGGLQILLPEFPGEEWHHFAAHWDAEKGRMNAFLDGTPYYWVDESLPPWKMKRSGSKVHIHADRFPLAQVGVSDCLIEEKEIRDIAGQEYLGRLDHLMGAKDLGRLDVEGMKGELLYQTDFSSEESVQGWKLEGPGILEFSKDGMIMASRMPDGPEGHVVFWCPETFPDRFIAEWTFKRLSPTGLCIAFFAANGKDGKDLFDPSLAARNGAFAGYINGDIDCYHISYYANTPEAPRRTTNLRRNSGFYLLASGPAGVLPDAEGVQQITLIKNHGRIRMAVDGKLIIDHTDEGGSWGEVLGSGKIGLRQMQWTRGLYNGFKVYQLRENI